MKKKNMIHPKVLFRVFIPFLPPNRSILSSSHIMCMISLKLYANNFFSMRWCACQLKCRINQSFLCFKMINLCPSAWNKTVIISVYYTIHTLSHIPNLKEHLPKKRERFLFQITLFA